MSISERINIPLNCKCGALQGIADVPASSRGGRIVCLCDDCQAYAHFLGHAADILDVNGGTDVFPVTPANLKITQGIENLKCCRLSDKGMYRWYAGCCKTPIGNTMPSMKTPYVGLLHTIMNYPADNRLRDQELGPILARVQGKFGIGPLPSGTLETVSLPIILRTIRFLLGSMLRREYKPSPFFDSSTGLPKAEPYILTLAERESLRPLCGLKAASSRK